MYFLESNRILPESSSMRESFFFGSGPLLKVSCSPPCFCLKVMDVVGGDSTQPADSRQLLRRKLHLRPWSLSVSKQHVYICVERKFDNGTRIQSLLFMKWVNLLLRFIPWENEKVIVWLFADHQHRCVESPSHVYGLQCISQHKINHDEIPVG